MLQTEKKSDFDIQEELKPYFHYWYWFIISAFILVLGGWIYVRYTPKLYEATASILIKDTYANDSSSEFAALEGLGALGNSFNSVENEIEVIRSRRLVTKAVYKLKLYTEYIREGNVASTNVYKNTPVLLNVLNDSSLVDFEGNLSLEVTPIDRSRFNYSVEGSDKINKGNFGIPISLNNLEFIILPNSNYIDDQTKFKNKVIKIKVNSIQSTVLSYAGQIVVEETAKKSSVLKLKISNTVPEKAEDFLNQLILEYNQDATNDANLVAQNTVEFIDERLRVIKQDLDSVETGIQNFKSNRDITELATEAQLGLQKLSLIETTLTETQSQIQIANALKNRIQESGNDFIPENVGVQSPELAGQSAKYNALLLAYRTQLKTATPQNDVVINLKSQLDATKESVITSINGLTKDLNIAYNNIRGDYNSTDNKISTIPLSEKLNRGIERNRSVKEAIFLLLSEKREATAISVAVTAPKAKIVDQGYAPLSPISPKSTVIYLGCLIVGLIIPAGIIYGRDVLYNKVESRKDLEKILPNVAILGEIPRLDKGTSDQVELNDRSVLAEAFRIIRTNLQFKLSTVNVTGRATRILVTSTIKGEGKTTVSYNLAATLANSGKKVLLIGADTRNPQVHRYLDNMDKRVAGVTQFLMGKIEHVSEIINPITSVPNLDVILSGAIPPNPAELWMQGRTKELFDQTESMYDIVLIDSSPTILVTDTLLIKDYADVTVYVTRANFTDLPLLNYVSDLVDEDKLKNVSLIINGVKTINLGYGNKYGYSYGQTPDSRWDKIKNKFRR